MLKSQSSGIGALGVSPGQLYGKEKSEKLWSLMKEYLGTTPEDIA